jgi:hypothetical protein
MSTSAERMRKTRERRPALVSLATWQSCDRSVPSSVTSCIRLCFWILRSSLAESMGAACPKILLYPRHADNAENSPKRLHNATGRNQPTTDSSPQLSASSLPIHQKYADHAEYHADKRSNPQPLVEKCPRH